jgi:glycosyltransferase involved in cell wall biosynthesis
MGADRPLVSVVLITRDRPALFQDALASVLDQTYERLEIVIVDGSEASVEPIARRRTDDQHRVRYRRDQGDGPGAARNIGLRAATGRFVAFLDDDDRWLPDKLQRQVAAFDPAAGTVLTGQTTVRDGEDIGGRTPSLSGWVTEDLLRGAPGCPTSSVMVRQEVVEQAGDFDEELPIWEDREWYVRLSKHGQFRSVPARLVRRGIHDHEHLTDDYQAARDVAYPRFLRKHRSLAAECGPSCERAFVASLSVMVGAMAIKTGHAEDARRWLFRALRNDPVRRQAWLYLLLSMGGRPARGAVGHLRRARDTLLDRIP